VTTYIVLIRAIGPETHAVMSMPALSARCVEAGLEDTNVCGATGNLVVRAKLQETTVQRRVQSVIASFGLDKPVFVWRRERLLSVLAANPMPEAAIARPSQLIVMTFGAARDLIGREALSSQTDTERFAWVGDDLVVDYVHGVARPKLPPQRIEARLKTKGTFRNWNTLTKLAALATASLPRQSVRPD